MDLQLFLAVNLVALSGLAIVLLLLMRVAGAGTWLLVNALVIVVGCLAITLEWPMPGLVTAALFVPLVLIPSVCNHRVVRYRLAQDLPRAARYARVAALFHPTADSRFTAALLAAMAHDTRAAIDDALSALAGRATPVQRCAVRAQKAVVDDDWQMALDVARAPECAAFGWLEIRALGALGRRNAMVAAYARDRARLVGPNLAFCQIYVLAYCGRRRGLETLLARMKMMHPDNVRFWRSVVALNADDGFYVARARADLEDLARTTRVTGLAEAARRHAVADAPAAGAHPTGQRSFESQSSESLSPESRAVVDDIEARLAREADTARANVRRSPVTLALIAANLAAFAAEIWFGGSQSSEALMTLGALWPPLVVEAGEWWRLIAAPFLHFGPVHLAANMFVLSLLGPLCESAFGRLPMLFAYMGGALLSNTAVLVMMIEGWTGHGVLVGASGAIFTLFGLLFVRRARLWLASRDVLDRQPILILLLALAVQFAIDLTLPEVSLAAHASGFLAGVLAGLILPGREPLPARVP